MEKDSVCADGLETLTKGSTLDISDIRLRQGETKPAGAYDRGGTFVSDGTSGRVYGP